MPDEALAATTEAETTPHLSVVIPVYRSATILPELHARLTRALEELGQPFEIIYVDDASPDDAWATLVGLRGDDARVTLIQLTQNSGQHRALIQGLAEARGEYVVTMDDDLQHPPEEIRVLYEALLAEDVDVMIGRYDSKKHGRTRLLGTSMVKAISMYSLGIPRDLELTSFRIMTRPVAHAIARQRRKNPVIGFMLFSATRRVSCIDVRHDPRWEGGSSYSRKALVDAFLVVLFDYTDRPLRAVVIAGAILSMGIVVLSTHCLVRWLGGWTTTAGFTTLAIVALLMSGAALAALGAVGAHLLRSRGQGERAPDAIVRRCVR